MYKYLLPLTSLLIIGCKPSVKVTPDTLPNAYVNQTYRADIKVVNSAVVGMSLHTEISSGNFKIKPKIKEDGREDYNSLVIKGLPKNNEPVTVYISGNTYGTNFPGERFKKTYTIKVYDKKVDK